jgi:hypothetical protein
MEYGVLTENGEMAFFTFIFQLSQYSPKHLIVLADLHLIQLIQLCHRHITLQIFLDKFKHLSDKALKAMYEVLKMGRLYKLSVKIQLDLFDKMIKPILLYGCEVWGFGKNEVLERVV